MATSTQFWTQDVTKLLKQIRSHTGKIKHGTVQGKEGSAAVVIIEIDICLHKCQKRLKGQFLFQLEVAELISYWKKEPLTSSLRCHFVKAVINQKTNFLFLDVSLLSSLVEHSKHQLPKCSVVKERERFALWSLNI